MSNDNTTDTVVDTNSNRRGSNGVVGQPTAGLAIRQLWHAANSGLSLKQFARKLLKGGDESQALVAREWFGNKAGSKNANRSDTNQKAAIEARAKSKAARKGSGGK